MKKVITLIFLIVLILNFSGILAYSQIEILSPNGSIIKNKTIKEMGVTTKSFDYPEVSWRDGGKRSTGVYIIKIQSESGEIFYSANIKAEGKESYEVNPNTYLDDKEPIRKTLVPGKYTVRVSGSGGGTKVDFDYGDEDYFECKDKFSLLEFLEGLRQILKNIF